MQVKQVAAGSHRLAPLAAIMVGAWVMVVTLSLFTPLTALTMVRAQGTATSTQMMAEAWEALIIGNFQVAIERAEACAKQHAPAAKALQTTLKDAPLLPTGNVSSADAEVIANQSVLNDAAMCIFVKAEALSKLWKFLEARPVYSDVLEFTHARVMDSVGWVLDPATLAAERLDKMHATMVEAGWVAFGEERYEVSMGIAEQCLKVYLEPALKEQTDLQRKRVKLPPTGAPSLEESEKIAARALLNDTGACLWIKAGSLDKLGRIPQAKQAYRDVQKLTYARIWDPQGWFWSPAEVAKKRLSELK